MRWIVPVALVVSGCGRVGFVGSVDAPIDGPTDGPNTYAAPGTFTATYNLQGSGIPMALWPVDSVIVNVNSGIPEGDHPC